MTTYDRNRHAAAHTSEYLFNQLIPYIGNKRRLVDLICRALDLTDTEPGDVFVDLFAGSGVVSRLAKRRGYRVISNDWEPYSVPINRCYIATNRTPRYSSLGGYEAAIDALNALPPVEDWITHHLCPRDDDQPDLDSERMFYMRKNGLRIDAIRCRIAEWKQSGMLDEYEEACLLAPLLYQACYRSNTSGVFKGFHRGWGGATRTALYRIATDLKLLPAVFHDNDRDNAVVSLDAQALAGELAGGELPIAYIDPPYNQHPYGSNYHVLNTIALWDRPNMPCTITPGTKAAIRTDWRVSRRSAHNCRAEASAAYAKLLGTLNAHYILTSYSTDGIIPLEEILHANVERGGVAVLMREYKRYRVSAQRFSRKPINVEFIVVTDTRARETESIESLCKPIREAERRAIKGHPESVDRD